MYIFAELSQVYLGFQVSLVKQQLPDRDQKSVPLTVEFGVTSMQEPPNFRSIG